VSDPGDRTIELPGTRLGAQATQYYADMVVQGREVGGFEGAFQQAVGWTGGLVAALWTPETAGDTAQVLSGLPAENLTNAAIGLLDLTQALAETVGGDAAEGIKERSEALESILRDLPAGP